jgi:hypothetical protein
VIEMRIETSERGQDLHQPSESFENTVFAFDRDYTVDVNPPREPDREAVPLEWVGYLAHHTDHIVYVIGNQLLKREAGIPGIAQIVESYSEVEGADSESDKFSSRPSRRERIRMLADLYPAAAEYIVIDDVDLSDLPRWTHYPSWEFVPAAQEGTIVDDLPPTQDALENVEVEPATDGTGSHF